jgi:uncharacterized phage protein (TIGR02220 family)
LLEIIGTQSEHYYDCRNPADWLFLIAKTRVSEVTATEILNTLSQVDAIDSELWRERVIWIQKFVDRLGDVYKKRGAEIPVKPSFCTGNPAADDIPVPESTQSKGTKVKEVKEIILYLNKKAGTSFRETSQKTKDLIQARFNEDFTLENFFTVIDNKVTEWLGGDMQKYLRPETLFSNKFEGYLNQKIISKKPPDYSDPDRYKNAESEDNPFG